MSARYVSSTFVKTVTTRTGRKLNVEIIDKTSAWTRPSDYPSDAVKEDFARVVEEQGDVFKEGVKTVAMKETAHESPADSATHYSSYGLDGNKREVLDAKHLKVSKK
ncbi:Hypothetical protein R9X50_00767400 [Acrodontium crateriforme]|uniref:Uncharacterized protein n=1 Tax=Acrodontium crateriforme TaxID=150365 RepID=A0AAQ3MBI2_9PEZI|nr:Hypothetical protein R9X50_00767400 [Acrodontium crateriforme]